MSTYETIDTTDDGELLVNDFVEALHVLTATAAECTTGLHTNGYTRIQRIGDAVGTVRETREKVEMRIYDLCKALDESRELLRDSRTAADELRDELDAAKGRENDLRVALDDSRRIVVSLTKRLGHIHE